MRSFCQKKIKKHFCQITEGIEAKKIKKTQKSALHYTVLISEKRQKIKRNLTKKTNKKKVLSIIL